jgi:hypothetical protein
MSAPINREALSSNFPKISEPPRPKGKVELVSEQFYLAREESPPVTIPKKTTRTWEKIDTRTSIPIPGMARRPLHLSAQKKMSAGESLPFGSPQKIFHCELGTTPESEEESEELQPVYGRYSATRRKRKEEEKENVPPGEPLYTASSEQSEYRGNTDLLQFPFEP